MKSIITYMISIPEAYRKLAIQKGTEMMKHPDAKLNHASERGVSISVGGDTLTITRDNIFFETDAAPAKYSYIGKRGIGLPHPGAIGSLVTVGDMEMFYVQDGKPGNMLGYVVGLEFPRSCLRKLARCKASDINDLRIKNLITKGKTTIWDITGAIPEFPFKVVQAKLRQMINKKRLSGGCACGCRGDFQL